MDYLIGDCSLDEIIKVNQDSQVSFMVSGRQTNLISNILNSEKLKNLIDKLKEQFD
ncbi:hypothetical protein KHQ89_05480 [Mycoplasmatota bacterium]|nr:hypothetical protein KHQ89_05480 [Mycoplasmatota bacterium]